MAFEISKTFVIRAAPAAVWEFLVDPQRVARCLPGAAVTEKLDDRTWAGTMTVKVGPVSSSYKGKVVFEKLDPQARRAEIVATGMDVKGRGGADLRLTSSLVEKAAQETEVTTVSRVNITGILAQMGRGMIQDVSDQMFRVFSERMRAELESAQPGEAISAPQAGAPPRQAAPGLPQAPISAPQQAPISAPKQAPISAPKQAPISAPQQAPISAPQQAPISAPQPALQQPPATVAVPPPPEALDLGALGARAALRRPEVWAAVVVLGVVLYLILR